MEPLLLTVSPAAVLHHNQWNSLSVRPLARMTRFRGDERRRAHDGEDSARRNLAAARLSPLVSFPRKRESIGAGTAGKRRAAGRNE